MAANMFSTGPATSPGVSPVAEINANSSTAFMYGVSGSGSVAVRFNLYQGLESGGPFALVNSVALIGENSAAELVTVPTLDVIQYAYAEVTDILGSGAAAQVQFVSN